METLMSDPLTRRPRELPVDLSVSRRVHVVGVGGPGMAPLAIVLAGLGHEVSGSDMRESATLDTVRHAGVMVTVGHDADLVNDVDLVVYSTAIPHNNVELVRARDNNIAVHHRSGILAGLCQQIPTIGVAGTHGKSTTSALVTHMLTSCGRDPVAIVGAEVPGLHAGARVGATSLGVLEADESDGTLETLPLAHIIVTNVDIDHLDHFGSFVQLQDVMVDVIARVTGVVVMNADDATSTHIASRVNNSAVRTFGYHVDADVCLQEVTSTRQGLEIKISVSGEVHECVVPLRGLHNAMNVAAAIAMLDGLGVPVVDALHSLGTFGGVIRRFTERGHFNGAVLVDDYAHLPAEIEAALQAMRTHPEVTGRVVAVFQPNRYHRIAEMYASYADCFKSADRIVITDIYASGTTPIPGVTGKLVWQAIRDAHPQCDVVWAATRADVVQSVVEYVRAGDGCISMGCGDIETFPDDVMAGVV
jgi:UDP-N-acetylmuramate--alanine ligase